jgi:hypothetical protein
MTKYIFKKYINECTKKYINERTKKIGGGKEENDLFSLKPDITNYCYFPFVIINITNIMLNNSSEFKIISNVDEIEIIKYNEIYKKDNMYKLYLSMFLYNKFDTYTINICDKKYSFIII